MLFRKIGKSKVVKIGKNIGVLEAQLGEAKKSQQAGTAAAAGPDGDKFAEIVEPFLSRAKV